MTTNRQIILKEKPVGELTPEHFELSEGAMPEIKDGELLCRTLVMSIDAANRAWMQASTYRAQVMPGDVMHTYAISEVLESKADGFKPGDIVNSESRWADYVAVPAKGAAHTPPHRPLSHLLSGLGIAGKTAYHGLLQIGAPKAGDTVVVSAAAGSVGIFVGQIAKALGCRAVGIAGGQEKCDWLVDELGFDAAVDYKGNRFRRDLLAACPDGIDVYFDNVGGNVLETALFLMNEYGRIVCCGSISQYESTNPVGPRNVPGLVVVRRLKMQGFIVMDYAEFDDQFDKDMGAWITDGKVKVVEDIVDGLENAPHALIGLLRGDNKGKRMVQVAADPV